MEMGSSSSTDASGASDSLINGLKFGRKIYFEDVGVGGSSSSSSSKALAPQPEPAALPARRGKGVMQGGGQPPRCQVEGCKVDLTGAKAYYCRHKVCGMHSKTPKVIVAGLEQRFCQQCSRFHQLPEFDQGKRSCRRRLAGHNERRRKPPPGSLSISHYGRPSSSFHDDSSRYRSFLMDFTYPRPPTAARDVLGTVRAHDRVGNHCPGSLAIPHGTHSYLQVPDSSSEFPPGQCLVGVSDSSCALSLLSTQPWGTPSCRNRAASFSANSGFYDDPMAQPVTNSCLANPWGFVVNRSSSSSHEMGLAHPGNSDNCQFSGELELALQGSRQYPNHGHSGKYDHSGHPMHWPH